MTTTNQNVTMYSGDSKAINVTVTLSGTLVGSTIKWSIGDDGVPIVTKTTSDGISITSSNIFKIELDPADTEEFEGKYTHEAEVTDTFGNVSTVLVGKFTILKDLVE